MSMRPDSCLNENRYEEEDRILWYHKCPFWTIESTAKHVGDPQRCSAKEFQKKKRLKKEVFQTSQSEKK